MLILRVGGRANPRRKLWIGGGRGGSPEEIGGVLRFGKERGTDVGSQNAVATIQGSAPCGPVSLCPPIPGDKYTNQNATKSKSLMVPLKHCQRGSKSQPTDTHLVILFSLSSHSQSLSCPILPQCFSAHPVIQPLSKFLHSSSHPCCPAFTYCTSNPFV